MQRDTAPEQMDAYSTETPGEGLADRQTGQSWLPDDANFSGDLISAYFRQMGNGALLSHEEEIALAKRIEAWQKVILNQLCRVPMLVECVLQWADELRQGSRRLRDFVEISALSQGTRLYDGAEQDADGAAEETEAIAATVDEPRGLADREARLTPSVLARTARISNIAVEMASLGRAGVAASSDDQNFDEDDLARREELLASLEREMEGLRLHSDRVQDLIDVLEAEQRTLRLIEQELLRSVRTRDGDLQIAGRAGLRTKILEIAKRSGRLPLRFTPSSTRSIAFDGRLGGREKSWCNPTSAWSYRSQRSTAAGPRWIFSI